MIGVKDRRRYEMIGVRDRRGKHVNINTFGINVEKQSRLKGIAGLAPI